MSIKFKIKIVKVGNSLRITIPKEIVEALRLKAGDSVDITVEDSRIIVCRASDTSKTRR
jgi:putative addiction module antidote